MLKVPLLSQARTSPAFANFRYSQSQAPHPYAKIVRALKDTSLACYKLLVPSLGAKMSRKLTTPLLKIIFSEHPQGCHTYLC